MGWLSQSLQRVKNAIFATPSRPTCALVLSGGGARAAYQVGVLRYIAEVVPASPFQVVTGVSAGAINAAQLANHRGSFRAATRDLEGAWEGLHTSDVFETESSLSLLWSMLRQEPPEQALGSRSTRGMVDTAPLHAFLEDELGADAGVLTGIADNLQHGRLDAVAILTTDYATGQTVSWVQGREIQMWERPDRVGRHTTLTVDHVMASTAIPIVFPAIRLEDHWHGDGGIRLAAPLAPAVHLGADRILAISTRYPRSRSEAATPAVEGYPPRAQVIGIMMNAIFLDALDQDALTMERINRLVRELPPSRRHDMRPIRLLELRPSVDLGRLAGDYDTALPTAMQYLGRWLGTEQTESPDWLSVLLFEHDYLARLLEVGYEDARAQHDRIQDFFSGVFPEEEEDREATRDAGSVSEQPTESQEATGIEASASAPASPTSDERSEQDGGQR
jgi:NTE family protein